MARQKYFTPYEVSAHNTCDDLWVSYLGKVCDLTPLMTKHKGDILLVPIIECAGKDISHWFYTESKDIRTHVDRLTGCVQYYTPRGRFLHVPPPCPRTDWATDFGVPWWRDNQYVVGRLSAKTRWIRIINTLTSQEQLMEVCCEETLEEILQRYSQYNSHASSYTWKQEGVCLDMSKTLSENGIPDVDEELDQCCLDRDNYTQSVSLYFNDDLTDPDPPQ